MEISSANNRIEQQADADVESHGADVKRQGPREFYKHAHPELFSDSKVTYEVP